MGYCCMILVRLVVIFQASYWVETAAQKGLLYSRTAPWRLRLWFVALCL